MNYENIAQPWTSSPSNSPVLPLRANSSYFLKHHPKNWELVEFKKSKNTKTKTGPKSIFLWLPKLHCHFEKAGSDGCRGSGQNIDSSISKARYSEKGWTILEPSKHDYLRVYPAQGGSYYVDKWTKLENLGGEIVTTYDREANNEFRRNLVHIGAIPLPHPQLLKRLIHDHSRMISNKTKFQHIPENKVRLDALYEINREMVKAMDVVKSDGVDAYEL